MSLILALLLVSPLGAQQVDDPEQEYREQYVRYQEVAAMADAGPQATDFLDFLEGGIDDRLTQFVVGGIVQDLQKLTQAGNFDAVYPLADRFVEVYPASLATARALALEAAAMAGDSENIIKYGEPFYEADPNPQIALLLTRSFGQLNNQPKMIDYGVRTLESDAFELSEIWNIVYTILQDHDRNGRDAQAVELAKLLRDGLTTAPEGVSTGDWRTIRIYLHDLIGRNDFEGRRYSEAVTSFDSILELDGQNDKAWYLKGNAMLQVGARPNDAADALANAVVLDGNYAGQARNLLERTAATNAPPGASAVQQYIDEKLAQARRRMGS